jgi:hypothetical protein
MKRYDDYLDESLAAEVKSEPRTAAAAEARKLGLTYGGFGRYMNRKGIVTHVVEKGKLVPFFKDDKIQDMLWKEKSKPKPESKPVSSKDKGKKPASKPKDTGDVAMKAWTTLEKRRADDGRLRNKFEKDASKVNNALSQHFREYFNQLDQHYYDTLLSYTEDSYEPINRYLYKGHDEGANKTNDSRLIRQIELLDEIIDNAEAPFPYTTYSGLSERYKPENIRPGEKYIFRGYISSSLSPQVAIDSFTGSRDSKNAKRVVLQIDIQGGQKALHVDEMSSNSGELESILPRGSMVEIISGPHVMEDDMVTDRGEGESQIYLFHCTLIQETEEE